MIKVGIIGASGMAGSKIYKAASQNPQLAVTGIVHNKDRAQKLLGTNANLLCGDVLKMSADDLQKFDVIVDALGTAPDSAEQQVTLAKKLVASARPKNQRLIFILGAGSLHTGADNHLVVEDIAKEPGSEEWINIPRQQLKEFEFLQTITDVNWLGISPSMEFIPGPASSYVIGRNDLLFTENGESVVTAGTMAKLIVKEVLNGTHHQERITIINAQ